jgi:hypothetical protein
MNHFVPEQSARLWRATLGVVARKVSNSHICSFTIEEILPQNHDSGRVLVSRGDPMVLNFLNGKGADMAVEAIKKNLSDHAKRGMP